MVVTWPRAGKWVLNKGVASLGIGGWEFRFLLGTMSPTVATGWIQNCAQASGKLSPMAGPTAVLASPILGCQLRFFFLLLLRYGSHGAFYRLPPTVSPSAPPIRTGKLWKTSAMPTTSCSFPVWGLATLTPAFGPGADSPLGGALHQREGAVADVRGLQTGMRCWCPSLTGRCHHDVGLSWDCRHSLVSKSIAGCFWVGPSLGPCRNRACSSGGWCGGVLQWQEREM